MQGSIASSTSHLQNESRWSSVGRMLGIVILLWVLAQFVVLIAAGFLDGDLDGDFGPLDGGLIIAGSLCSAPLVILLLFMRRPKLEHLIIAEPTVDGQHVHSLPNSKIIQTPVPTRIRQFIVRSRHPLRVPVAKHLWMLFLGLSLVSELLFLVQPTTTMSNNIFLQFVCFADK